MRIAHKPEFGLGANLFRRILAILLVAVLIEFAAGALLYERISDLTLKDEEAHRLAEHLVIARKFLEDRPRAERPAMAMELTTERYEIVWATHPVPFPGFTQGLARMHRQMVGWEPTLRGADIRMKIATFGSQTRIAGGLTLHDGSWMGFATQAGRTGWDVTGMRIGLATIPVLALIIIAALMVRAMLHPLGQLVHAAETIETDDGQDVPLPQGGTAEVRLLTQAFADMRRRIRQMIAERTQALASVGHDLRTPLARIRLRLDALEDSPARHRIEADVTEMELMINSLLAYLNGASDPEPPTLVDLAVMTDTQVAQFEDMGEDIVYAGPDHLSVRLRPGGMRRAISNLIENGLHYGGSVCVRLAQEGDTIRLTVEDNGPGIAEADMAEALRPFGRLDSARGRNTGGMGLGLAIVQRAIALEGGSLLLANRPEGGLAATLLFPARRPAVPSPSSPTQAAPPSQADDPQAPRPDAKGK